VHPRPIVTMEH